ncbi:hypothetical protein L211DRAFT_324947 [Terfezia boudieri ATCC MYA-4762]|uniref:Uncharacterized protein n=1 Tax=Terfezia boudieri ATCC MYA-4762 TaxID=1051890 RepID=A0A3N4LI85_9PEZI|nr:hypothetical protein L211DRAFT_324947 [Terfezia boudieri ATCC MYA-4762]
MRKKTQIARTDASGIMSASEFRRLALAKYSLGLLQNVDSEFLRGHKPYVYYYLSLTAIYLLITRSQVLAPRNFWHIFYLATRFWNQLPNMPTMVTSLVSWTQALTSIMLCFLTGTYSGSILVIGEGLLPLVNAMIVVPRFVWVAELKLYTHGDIAVEIDKKRRSLATSTPSWSISGTLWQMSSTTSTGLRNFIVATVLAAGSSRRFTYLVEGSVRFQEL